MKKISLTGISNLKQVLASYRITSNLATAETPFFLVYGRDPNLPLHQLLEPMQHFLGDPNSSMLNLETHRLALAIVKKTLDENRFKTAQKTMERKCHPSKLEIVCTSKTNSLANGTYNGGPDIELSALH